MAIFGSVQITGFIAPTYSADTYATHDAYYGRDGLRNVDTESELDQITALRRRSGMIVGVSGGTIHYRLLPEPWSFTFSDWTLAFLTPTQAAGAFTGNTSATCITDLWVSNIHGCSPITIWDSIQSNGSVVNGDYALAFGTSVSALTSSSVAHGENSLAQASEILPVPTPTSIYSAITIGIDPYYSQNAIIFSGDVGTEWIDYVVTNGGLSTFVLLDGLSGETYTNSGGTLTDLYYDNGYTYIVDPTITLLTATIISGTGYYSLATIFGRPAFSFGTNTQSLGVNSFTVGKSNINLSDMSSISGGENSEITGSPRSVIGGGFGNKIYDSERSTIGGGHNNILRNNYTANIGGGFGNKIYNTSGWIATIGGGYNNYIKDDSGYGSVIAGGDSNKAYYTTLSVIGGGKGNGIWASSGYRSKYSSIGGGFYNYISGPYGQYSTIGGGRNNITYGYDTFIGGGNNNTIGVTWRSATITNGWYNEIGYTAGYSFIGGGGRNKIKNIPNSSSLYNNFIGGGQGNVIGSETLPGVYFLYLDGFNRNTILNGKNNRVMGNYNTILGGHLNTVIGINGFIGGEGSNCLHNLIGEGEGNYITTGNSKTLILNGTKNVIGQTISPEPSTLFNGSYDAIINGTSNQIIKGINPFTYGPQQLNSWNTIINGDSNKMLTDATNYQNFKNLIGTGDNNEINYRSKYDSILNGQYNVITSLNETSQFSTILNGQNNYIGGGWSAILGGVFNEIPGNISHVYILGRYITATTSNFTYVNNFNIWNTPLSGSPTDKILVRDGSTGDVKIIDQQISPSGSFASKYVTTSAFTANVTQTITHPFDDDVIVQFKDLNLNARIDLTVDNYQSGSVDVTSTTDLTSVRIIIMG